jgi:hypothetical protein
MFRHLCRRSLDRPLDNRRNWPSVRLLFISSRVLVATQGVGYKGYHQKPIFRDLNFIVNFKFHNQKISNSNINPYFGVKLTWLNASSTSHHSTNQRSFLRELSFIIRKGNKTFTFLLPNLRNGNSRIFLLTAHSCALNRIHTPSTNQHYFVVKGTAYLMVRTTISHKFC